MRRPYLEIDCPSINFHANSNLAQENSVSDFLDYIHHKKNIKNTKIIEANKHLLTSLIKQNYISRSSIIWDKNYISKIYGISFDDNQYIQFHNKNDYTERQKSKVLSGNPIDDNEIHSIKKAFMRAKETKLWQT